MFCSNRPGGLRPNQARQFSTIPENKPLYNTISPSPTYLNKLNLQNISSQKKFVNPNFVNRDNPNIHNCLPNLSVSPCRQSIREICSEFTVKTNANSFNILSKVNLTEQVEVKEKQEQMTNKKKLGSSCSKTTKNLSNMDLKCDFDEIGIDVLNDGFEGNCSEMMPNLDIQSSSKFTAEGFFVYDNKKEICKMPSSPICITIETPSKMPAVVVSISEGISRNRLLSDCGSEDSSIVFVRDGEDDDILDYESDMESDFTDSDSLHSDEYDDEEILTADNEDCKDSINMSKKVTFAENLNKVYPMVTWAFAYQSARRGPWEQLARDRGRFKDRINRCEEILRPILRPDHREKVYQERYL